MGMSEQIKRNYNDELLKLLDDFRQKIIEGTANADDFLSITEIENMWSKLRGDTSLLYSDALAEILSSVDESELIRKKKPNIAPKE
jgi:hypothetical protein